MNSDTTVHRDGKNALAEVWLGRILGRPHRSALDVPSLARVVAEASGATMTKVKELIEHGQPATNWEPTHPAPDFGPARRGVGYPSGGTLIGPAWAWAYAILRDAHGPVDLKSLARVMSALTGAAQASCEDILHRSAREALTVKARHNVGGRSRTTLRLKDVYR